MSEPIYERSAVFYVDPRLPLMVVCMVAFIMGFSLSHIRQDSPKDIETPEGIQSPPADSVFLAPYDHYVITQGLHGFSYGHMAVDLAAGRGAEIKSPIHGIVTANYRDYLGNTTLVIENDLYEVTLLHGNYHVRVGDVLVAGQVIGTESNQGYTTDMQGVSCRGRDCGYHTHLNVYNKRKEKNINPLKLLDR